MLKIVHCVPSLTVGGTEMMVYKTLRHMNARRFSSVVVSLRTLGPLGERMAAEGLRVIALGLCAHVEIPLTLWRLCRVLAREKADLLQTYLYPANVFGVIAGRLAGVPVVSGLRCSRLEFERYRPIAAVSFRLNALLSGLPRATVVNSKAGLEYHAAHGFRGRRMFVVPNGFELDRFRPDPAARLDVRCELGVPDDALLVGRFARFDPMKDYATFVSAARRVARPAHFVCAGEGVTRKNPAFAECDDRFHLLDGRDDMPRLTAAMDLCVSSSAFGEGFPNVVGEAMACGVPCVVTEAGDSAYVVGDTGRVVPPGDAGGLARAIDEMLAFGRDGLQSAGERARRRVEEHFDIRRVVERLQDLYEELAHARNGR